MILAREKRQAGQGRREPRYAGISGTTEDAARRRFAAAEGASDFRDGALSRADELAELIERARSLRNQDERMRLYHEIDRVLVAERAILPLSYGRVLLLRRPWVENLWADPMSGAHLDHVVITRRSAPR